jgi:pimeloyl-ACP methyl ester carboxylesterase
MDFTVQHKAIYAATGGRPFDPAQDSVVFVHGAGMDHTVWALQTRYFAHHGRSVVALDLPGHGRSAGPALESIAAMADWLDAFLHAAGIGTAALVGHSMGALIALETATRFPGRVRALALLGAAPRMPVHPDLLAAAQANDPLAYDLIMDWGHGRAGHVGGNRAPGLWLMGGSERLLERGADGVLHGDLAACNAYDGGAAAAARVACPALLVLGSEDRMTPAKAGRKLALAISGARVTEIAGCGHMMMLEKPDETLDALRTIV